MLLKSRCWVLQTASQTLWGMCPSEGLTSQSHSATAQAPNKSKTPTRASLCAPRYLQCCFRGLLVVVLADCLFPQQRLEVAPPENLLRFASLWVQAQVSRGNLASCHGSFVCPWVDVAGRAESGSFFLIFFFFEELAYGSPFPFCGRGG